MNRKSNLIPACRVENSFVESNSRFITNAAPAFSVDAAHSFISSIKDKYPDASHHVPAFLIGHGSATIAHCSDDGEPSGTAGKPALSVLQGSGLGDIAVVITRYFGGTKLGTGGLVRAYSDSVRQILEKITLARKVSTTTVMCVVEYALYEQAKLLVCHHDGQIKDQSFGADVTLTLRFADEYFDSFKQRMIDLTSGKIEFITIAHCENTIMPVRNGRNC